VHAVPPLLPRLLPRDALAVDVLDAARTLLGSVLVASTTDGEVAVRLVEVEAYRGADDPASHSYRGRTPRNAVMWGPAGHLYVYFVYGMHYCANVVCLTDGVPGAVLLRAGEVIGGLDAARHRRPTARADAELARGPARLCAALDVTRQFDGWDLTAGRELWIAADAEDHEQNGTPLRIVRSRRIGVTSAHHRLLRFFIAGSPYVSGWRSAWKVVPSGSPRRSTT